MEIQAINWFTKDYTNTDGIQQYVIKIFGIKMNGERVSVNVLDYKPNFYVKTRRPNVIMELLDKEEIPYCSVDLCNGKDYWGFNNDKEEKFVNIVFDTVWAFKKAAKVLNNTYEANIDPHLRLCHVKNIQPSGWVIVKNYYRDNTIYPDRKNTNISCSWKDIRGIEKQDIAPIKIASFDIECDSSHGDFPQAIKKYSRLANELKKTSNKQIYNDIVAAFNGGNEDVSKVYAKSKLNTDKLTKNLQKILHTPNSELVDVFDKILPPLYGDPIIQIGTTIHKYGEKECYHKSILTLGTCSPIEGVKVIECDTEKELLILWKQLILEEDPDIITGYNIFGFDFEYMHNRSIELGIQEAFLDLGKIRRIPSKYVEKQLSSSAMGDNILKFIEMPGRTCMDIMKIIQKEHKLDSFKLDNVAHHFMGLNKNDVSPADIFRLQKGSAEDRATIAKYCVQDCNLCNLLTIKLEIIANNIGMSNVCIVPLSYIFMRGQGIKIFSLVSKECRDHGYRIPVRVFREGEKQSYEGAIVLEPNRGVYIDNPITVFDYASLYPASMISSNLSHNTIVLDPKYSDLDGIKYETITFDTSEGPKSIEFVQNRPGIIPIILSKLLKQRKLTRKKINYKTVSFEDGSTFIGIIKNGVLTTENNEEIKIDVENVRIKDTYNEFQKAVLDGLQLAYKITANSIYGQCGATTSPICMKDIAACTTAIGRDMILKAKKYIEDTVEGAEIVYGDTDSVFVKFTTRDEEGNILKGREAINPSREIALKIVKSFKTHIKAPHELEYEKIFWPFILFEKKRYCANKYEWDDIHFVNINMGTAIKRRDNAPIVKKIYGGVLDIILNEQNIQKSVEFLKKSLNDLINNKYPLEDFIISKTLKGHYVNPDQNCHVVLAKRMAMRDPGNKPSVNERIPYAFVQTKNKKSLQGDRIEHPDFIRQNKLKIDYEMYIENQIMSPITKLYSLFIEDLKEFKKDKNYYKKKYKSILESKDGDHEKTLARLNKLKEDELCAMYFKPVINSIVGDTHKITKFFTASRSLLQD